MQSNVSAQDKTDETKIRPNIPAGSVQGYIIVYDCYNCRVATSDKIIVYAKKNNKRIKLLVENLGDNYMTGVYIKHLLNHPFIYITYEHTHGHFYGELYALDIGHLKVKAVSEIRSRSHIQIPDSIQYRNNDGIRIDEKNNISDGASYKSNDGENYFYNCQYKLIKIKDNTYRLEPIKESFNKLDY